MSRRSTVLFAATAALLVALPVASGAGDIYDKAPRHGSAYDDPRYADIYGDGPVRRYEPPRYAERHEPRYEPRPSYRDEDEYLRPMPGARRFEERRYSDRGGCIDRREIRDQLVREGWHDFNDLEIRSEAALVTARRPNGNVYRLKVDRCTGDILSARALHGSRDSYAERRGAYRY